LQDKVQAVVVAKIEPSGGNVVQHEQPHWAPLLRVLGHDLASFFMWMFEVELVDETRLDAYKHATTRRYLHLDGTGRTFHYHESGGYQEVAAPIAIARVFVGWEHSSPTDEDAAALRAAIRRARATA
jgi:hypothetical protein